MRWMEIAWAEVGVHETAGEASTPSIVRYFRDAGRPEVAADEVPWCAAFHNAALAKAGISIDAIPRGERLLARSCTKATRPIKALRVGATCVVRRGADPAAGHVGFIVGWSDTHVQLLGGNQGNAVTVASFPRADIVDLGWPGSPATAAELEAAGSRIAAASGRQQRDVAKTGVVQVTQGVPPQAPSLGGLAEKAGSLKGTLETLESFVSFAAGRWTWIAGALAVYWVARMGYDALVIRAARTEDHNTGAATGRAASAGEPFDVIAA